MKGNRTVHGAAEDNSLHPMLGEYRQALRDAGFKPDVIYGYVKGAKMYLKEGQPLNREAAKEWLKKKKEEGDEVRANKKTGIYSFLKYLNGETLVRKDRKNKSEFDYRNPCDEDCFNCKYKDCIRPDYMCKSIPYEDWVGRDTFEYDVTELI